MVRVTTQSNQPQKCMRKILIIASFVLPTILMLSCTGKQAEISGELKQWHTLTFAFNGPSTSEGAEINPFTDYRLTVTFARDNRLTEVRGYYAADGNAAETGSEAGGKWKVKFVPDEEGEWKYFVSFRRGDLIAIDDNPRAGTALEFDGITGSFVVGPSDKSGRDFRARGRLLPSDRRYFKFSGTGDYFLKGGAGSPENFLAYKGFDGTRYHGTNTQRMGEAQPNATLHEYPTHVADWREGDPDWKGGQGKAIVGAINYLASKGMNSVYFLTLNIEGDGDDVWPYRDYNERRRFDCSKLDQWDILFSHMESQGVMLHVVTQETENQLLLDSGNTGIERKLYYRELIARFGHHLGVTWNMGEENGYADFSPNAQNHEQQEDMIRYVKTHDPYKNPVVIHTHADPKYMYPTLEALLGFEYLDGPSLQVGNPAPVHTETLTWTERSKSSGHPWVVNLDEIGPASRGVDPDDRTDENNQATLRSQALWGNLMAGGGGTDWYFGYTNHNNDLACEDWRSRDNVWDYTRHALEFFHRHLRFWEMEPADELTSRSDDYCLASKGEQYVIYVPRVEPTTIDLTGAEGTFGVMWYNPRSGGGLVSGSVAEIRGGRPVDVGLPPTDLDKDWAILLTKK